MLNKIITKIFKTSIVAMLGLFLSLISITAAAELDITLVAPEWTPINAKATDPKPGYLIDLAKTILQPVGYSITYKNVDSWQQAVKLTREGVYNCVVGTSKSETPDFIFPKAALGSVTTMFYVKKGNAWRYNNDLNNLKTKRFGMVADNNYGSELMNFLNANNSSVTVNIKDSDTAVQQNIEDLVNDKLDVVLETNLVMEYYLNKTGFAQQVEPAGAYSVDDIYIACSPAEHMVDTSEKIAKLLSEGLNIMRTDGSLKTILDAYGINNWVK